MAYATNMAAMNAARKQYGADWKKFVQVEKLDGEWHATIRPLETQDAALSLSDEREGAFEFPTALSVAAGAGKLSLIGSSQAEAQASAAAFFASRGAAIKAEEVIVEDETEDEADYAEAAREAEAKANAQQTSEFKGKQEWVKFSSVPKPTKRVWHIADEMVRAALAAGKPIPSRKEVQDECVRRGIASGTARTQYQAWKKANDDTLANAKLAEELSAKLNGGK